MFEAKTVTIEELQSLIDGELDDRASDHVLDAVLNSPALFGKLTYYMGQREQLRIWWRAHKMEH